MVSDWWWPVILVTWAIAVFTIRGYLTRAVSILEVTATMRGFTPPAPPILIGALTVMSR